MSGWQGSWSTSLQLAVPVNVCNITVGGAQPYLLLMVAPPNEDVALQQLHAARALSPQHAATALSCC